MKTAHYLNDQQQAQLRAAARVGRDYIHENRELELTIARIRNANPNAFWTPETLILRKFYHAPKFPIPHQSSEVNA
jgi:hypothetical protein